LEDFVAEVKAVPARHNYKEIKDFSKLMDIPDPVGSTKRDGAAFWIVFDKDGSPHFLSRKPSVTGSAIERTAQLPHVTEGVQIPELAGHVLYSELVHTGHSPAGPDRHALLSGILNSGLEKSIEAQKQLGPVRVILTDVKHPPLPTYGEKIEAIKRVAKLWDKPDLVEPADFTEGHEPIRNLIDRTRLAGREGVIVTSLSKPEPSNPRFKVKHFNTYNLKVSGFQEEKDINGTPKGRLGALLVTDADGREVAAVGTGFTHALRQDIWDNRGKWLGKLIQVKAMPTTARRLRAPVYNGEADGEIDAVLPLY